MHDSVEKTLATVLEDNAKAGTCRVARDIFTDPEIFEREMKHIFEGNWIYLAHESQIPNKNDYFTIGTRSIGRPAQLPQAYPVNAMRALQWRCNRVDPPFASPRAAGTAAPG